MSNKKPCIHGKFNCLLCSVLLLEKENEELKHKLKTIELTKEQLIKLIDGDILINENVNLRLENEELKKENMKLRNDVNVLVIELSTYKRDAEIYNIKRNSRKAIIEEKIKLLDELILENP